MHDQELSIVRALVPVAWADGDFADKEKEMLDALLDAYGATAAQRKALQEYAAQKRTLDDIDQDELIGGALAVVCAFERAAFQQLRGQAPPEKSRASCDQHFHLLASSDRRRIHPKPSSVPLRGRYSHPTQPA